MSFEMMPKAMQELIKSGKLQLVKVVPSPAVGAFRSYLNGAVDIKDQLSPTPAKYELAFMVLPPFHGAVACPQCQYDGRSTFDGFGFRAMMYRPLMRKCTVHGHEQFEYVCGRCQHRWASDVSPEISSKINFEYWPTVKAWENRSGRNIAREVTAASCFERGYLLASEWHRVFTAWAENTPFVSEILIVTATADIGRTFGQLVANNFLCLLDHALSDSSRWRGSTRRRTHHALATIGSNLWHLAERQSSSPATDGSLEDAVKARMGSHGVEEFNRLFPGTAEVKAEFSEEYAAKAEHNKQELRLLRHTVSIPAPRALAKRYDRALHGFATDTRQDGVQKAIDSLETALLYTKNGRDANAETEIATTIARLLALGGKFKMDLVGRLNNWQDTGVNKIAAKLKKELEAML